LLETLRVFTVDRVVVFDPLSWNETNCSVVTDEGQTFSVGHARGE